MKRLAPEQSHHVAKRARSKWLKSIRRRRTLAARVRNGKRAVWKRPTNHIEAPRVFSLSKNYDETLECLQQLKDSIVEGQRLGARRPNTFIDLANIEDLQPAAAIVLAAELDRWRRALGVRLKPRRIHEWSKSVLEFLNDLGLFDLLEIDRRHLRKVISDKPNGISSRVALPFVSDCRNDKEITDTLSDELAERVPTFKEHLEEEGDMALSTALAEASLNCVPHAYCHSDTLYPVQDDRWWAAASYQDDRKTVKFFVYDQGAGIPATLPKTDVGKDILKVFGVKVEGVTPLSSPSDMIRYVLENQISATKKQYRGKGFPQIVAAATQKGGSLRVISGRGSAIYTLDNGAEALPGNSRHLGGTLLEWTFRLDEL